MASTSKIAKKCTNYFEYLPLEVLEMIIRFIPIQDCNNLFNAFPDQTQQINWKRLILLLTNNKVPLDWNVDSEENWNRTFTDISKVRHKMLSNNYVRCEGQDLDNDDYNYYWHEWNGDYLLLLRNDLYHYSRKR